MKTGDFNRDVSLIARVVAKGVKHRIRDLVKACASRNPPISMEPNKPADDATEK